MGAVSFSLDAEFASALRDFLGARVLVETGTFHGETTEIARQLFEEVITIELSDDLYAEAVERFGKYQNVKVIGGDSAAALADLRAKFEKERVIYFLDAHWCIASDTLEDDSQCPLLAELAAIERLNTESAVLIDDARLFLSPPLKPHDISQWPNFDEVLLALSSLSSIHKLLVVNDVIAFLPPRAYSGIREFAHQHGHDWLKTLQDVANLAEIERDRSARLALIIELTRKIDVIEADRLARLAAINRLQAELDTIISQLEQIKS